MKKVIRYTKKDTLEAKKEADLILNDLVDLERGFLLIGHSALVQIIIKTGGFLFVNGRTREIKHTRLITQYSGENIYMMYFNKKLLI